MLAEDTFRTRLHDTIRTLRAWSETLKTDAEVREIETGDYWDLILRPYVPTACPVELILYRAQRYDISIGSETYENLPAEDLAILPLLLASIADGQAITRTWSTRATSLLHSIETLVPITGRTWQAGATRPIAARVAREACMSTDRHYAPYRWRATAA